MKTVGDKLEAFRITGVKPGFNQPDENGISAFEPITESSFPGKWKVIYFYPKDFSPAYECIPVMGAEYFTKYNKPNILKREKLHFHDSPFLD